MSLNLEPLDHVKQAFTELASTYTTTMDAELNQFWGVTYLEFIDRLVSMAAIMPGEKVLDIATGTAMIPIKLTSFHQRRNRIVGLDITPAMLQQGRKVIEHDHRTDRIDLVCASAMEMPFANGIFDVIICGLGTHHMNVPCMLFEAKRLLVKSGRLIISDVGATPFWRSVAGKLLIRVLMIEYGFIHQSARAQAEIEAFQNVRTAKEWSKLLGDFGYVKIHIEEIKPRLPWFPSGLTLQAEVTA